ncbi:acyl-CoA thioesterase [bacterium]|nr:acyl-CoA thioesterase [bacterium]
MRAGYGSANPVRRVAGRASLRYRIFSSKTRYLARNPMPNNRPLSVQLPFPPATYDIDFEGHVNNIVYIRWMEDLRIHWLETWFPLRPRVEAGIAPALTHTEIDYIRPIRLFQNVKGFCWVEKLEKVRMYLAFEWIADGEVAARGRQTGVWIRIDGGRPVRVPAELRELVAQTTDEDE